MRKNARVIKALIQVINILEYEVNEQWVGAIINILRRRLRRYQRESINLDGRRSGCKLSF